MTKLTDMQLALLTAACQREDGSLLPPPDSLGVQPTRIRKAIEALIKKDLAIEKDGMAAARSWRTDGDVVIGVVVTDMGRAIIEPPVGSEDESKNGEETEQQAPPSQRPMSKQAMVLNLLKCDGGATLSDIVATTGWLPHTSRAALTGLRKKGHMISTTKMDGITRYQIAAA